MSCQRSRDLTKWCCRGAWPKRKWAKDWSCNTRKQRKKQALSRLNRKTSILTGTMRPKIKDSTLFWRAPTLFWRAPAKAKKISHPYRKRGLIGFSIDWRRRLTPFSRPNISIKWWTWLSPLSKRSSLTQKSCWSGKSRYILWSRTFSIKLQALMNCSNKSTRASIYSKL